ncbi:flavin monoamine oxidase family protein [Roseibium sp. M-1]
MLPSRRLFLKSILFGLGSSALFPRVHPVRATTGHKVIVIGAGMSGLSAAQTLAGEGYDVTLLEARQRIGGRIWTDRSLGVPLDLGASWIHGTKGNPVTELARRFSQPLYDWDYDNGEVIDLTGHDARASDQFDAFTKALEDYADEHDDALTSLSVADAIARVKTKNEFRNLSDAELGFLAAVMFELEFAADAQELSLAGVAEGSGYSGPDAVLPNGYEPIALGLADGLTIRLGTPVDEISYSQAGVEIRAGKDVIEADYAICCVPLGVLKAGTIDFNPGLPAAKSRAIERLAMGVLNKVYLGFPKVFWDENVLNFGRISEKPKQFADWFNLAPVSKARVLCSLNAGSFALDLEKFSDQERQDAAFAALQTMFGRDIPPPVSAISTAWRSDPYAGGSYSFLPVGTDPSERVALADSLKSRVFFAGEATSSEYPATVHGAYLSGERAARQVMAAAG